jgi:hypothetical protein
MSVAKMCQAKGRRAVPICTLHQLFGGRCSYLKHSRFTSDPKACLAAPTKIDRAVGSSIRRANIEGRKVTASEPINDTPHSLWDTGANALSIRLSRFTKSTFSGTPPNFMNALSRPSNK